MNKLLSGRYVLTVICGIVFAYGVINKLIPPDATVSIISMVFISYFNKPVADQNGGVQK